VVSVVLLVVLLEGRRDRERHEGMTGRMP